MHIYINIVSSNGVIASETTNLLLTLQQMFNELKTQCTICISNPSISYWDARNHTIKTFKEHEEYTHLLLLSDKITTDPRVLLSLLKSKHDVACLVPPLGTIKWTNMFNKKNVEAINTIINYTNTESDNKEQNILNFWTWLHSNINIYNSVFDKEFKLEEQYINVNTVATDFMLITKEIINKLETDTPFTPRLNTAIKDQSFCEELNKHTTIWAYIDATVTKISNNQFIGRLRELITPQFVTTPEPKEEEITDCDSTEGDVELQPDID